MCSLWLVIGLVVYNISTKWNKVIIIFMGIVKISVPVNSPTKYYTNLYDRIPLTYITILLQDNIILCQEIFLLF